MKQPKVGNNLIWVKRVLPILLIIISWYGYDWYHADRIQKQQEAIDEYAEVTAQIWVKAAEYRDSNELFLAYRDSLLQEHNLNRDSVLEFVQRFEHNPEMLGPLVVQIKNIVDSLIIAKEPSQAPDSTLLE